MTTGHESSAYSGALRKCLSYITCLYCVVLFFFLPLVFHDKYFDIGRFKYDFFFYSTAALLISCFLLLAAGLILKLSRRETELLSVLKRLGSISAVDKAVLAYALICLISFIISPYNTGSLSLKNGANPPLTGYPGWNMGLISQLFFAGIYFITSRFADRACRRIIMGALFAGSLLTFIIGILNRFSIDPLGFYEGVSDYHRLLFLSTLGQATWYSSFLCTLLPVSLALFIYERRNRYRCFYALYIATASMSLVTQNSDSAYAALSAALLVLFTFALERNNYFIRFFQLILIIFISFRVTGLLQLAFREKAVLPGALSMSLSTGIPFMVLTLILTALYLVLSFLQIRYNFSLNRISFIRMAVLVFSGIAVVFCAAVLILTGNGVRVPFLEEHEYFVFNDDWGNGRGFTWRVTLEMFSGFPFLNKLFGIGPDCYAEYAYEYRSAQMKARWGSSVLANAHNEWLNMLFNLGIAGFTAYMSIFAAAFRGFISRRRITALSIAGAASIAAYLSHNFFCYQQVLCTPYIFAIIGICRAFERRHGGSRRVKDDSLSRSRVSG